MDYQTMALTFYGIAGVWTAAVTGAAMWKENLRGFWRVVQAILWGLIWPAAFIDAAEAHHAAKRRAMRQTHS